MAHHKRLNMTLVGAVLVAAVAGVVLGTGASAARVARGRAETGVIKAPAQASLSQQGASQPPDVYWLDRLSILGKSPNFRSQTSTLVAEVTVASIGSPYFNTAGGGVPTTSLDDDDDSAWRIDRLATLNVVTMYAGDPVIDRIVTSIMGGTYVNAADAKIYQHIVSGPDYTRLHVGDTAMIFGYRPFKPTATGSTPWAQRALALVAQLQGQGYDTVYGTVTAAYIYSGASATSSVDHVTLPITNIRNIAQNP